MEGLESRCISLRFLGPGFLFTREIVLDVFFRPRTVCNHLCCSVIMTRIEYGNIINITL